MALGKATVTALRDDFNLAFINEPCTDMTKEAVAAGVRMEDYNLLQKEKGVICKKYRGPFFWCCYKFVWGE